MPEVSWAENTIGWSARLPVAPVWLLPDATLNVTPATPRLDTSKLVKVPRAVVACTMAELGCGTEGDADLRVAGGIGGGGLSDRG